MSFSGSTSSGSSFGGTIGGSGSYYAGSYSSIAGSVAAAGSSNTMSDDSCPQDGSAKADCLFTTLRSCTIPCQEVVSTIYNLTDDTGEVPSSGLDDARSTIDHVCGKQFAHMDACLHCSRNGFGLRSDNFHNLLLPWSRACSTWMNHGPSRAYECLQGYTENQTTACDSALLLQVAGAGQMAIPASKSLLLLGLGMVAFLGLGL